MRTFGIFLLGLGIALLIPSGFALASSENLTQVLGWLVCTGLIPILMIVPSVKSL